MKQTAASHVTSTTTSGKYLNPETIDLNEIYSKRTPLDLLIETCNNIGKEAGSQQTGAKQRRPRTTLRGQSGHGRQTVSTKHQDTRLNDVDSGNDATQDWYPTFHDNKGTRSDGDEEALRHIPSKARDVVDQEGPEDLRLWCHRESPDGSSMLNSPEGSGRKSPWGESLSSLSPSSHPSPTLPDGMPYTRFSHEPEEVKRPIGQNHLAESLRERNDVPANHPQGLDARLMLHQYLELQSMLQLAILQERANQVRRYTLEKPLSAFTSPVLSAAELSPESRNIFGLSDIPACHPLLSKLQQEEILRSLSSGVTLDGLPPVGLSYLGETSPFRGPLPLPPFYHQHLATKAGLLTDSFLPGMFQLRPEEMVFGNSPLLYAKHLELLSHLSDSPLCRKIPPYDVSRPTTRCGTPDCYMESCYRLSPEKTRAMQIPSRMHSSKSSPSVRSVQRHHPYGRRSESPSTPRSPISSKSSPSFSRPSTFREPVRLSETL